MRKILLLNLLMVLGTMQLWSQAYPDRHNTSWTDAWVSCVETESPNIKRDPGHWIMYDFGDQYSLHESTIWNFNVPDTTQRGMNEIVVDYSDDGVNWTELTEYTVPEAPGSTIYQGVSGPDFEGVVARYVLISILSNHGDANCVGMSELRINATIATSTNIPDTELNLDLTASPNPASEFTVVSISDTDEQLSFALLDMSGKLLRQGMIQGNRFKLNTANLPTAIYSLVVYNSNGKQSILINVVNR